MASLTKLLELLNALNPQEEPFSEENIRVISVASDSSTGKNTKAVVEAIAGERYSGQRDIFYDRIDLAAVQDDSGLISATAFTPELICSKIAENWNTWFDVSDLEAFVLPDTSDGEIHDVVLTAKPTSLGWFGSVRISLVQAETDTFNTSLHTTLPNIF